jgi:hypothetical protein
MVATLYESEERRIDGCNARRHSARIVATLQDSKSLLERK